MPFVNWLIVKTKISRVRREFEYVRARVHKTLTSCEDYFLEKCADCTIKFKQVCYKSYFIPLKFFYSLLFCSYAISWSVGLYIFYYRIVNFVSSNLITQYTNIISSRFIMSSCINCKQFAVTNPGTITRARTQSTRIYFDVWRLTC